MVIALKMVPNFNTDYSNKFRITNSPTWNFKTSSIDFTFLSKQRVNFYQRLPYKLFSVLNNNLAENAPLLSAEPL